MKHTTLTAAFALLAVASSTPVLAGDTQGEAGCDHQHTTDKRAADGYDYGMKEVINAATPESPGYGWRYFTDPVARRAVVISPQGNYYFSSGQGLQWIAAEHT